MKDDLSSRLKLLEETAVICENEEKIRNMCSKIMLRTDEKNHFDVLCLCRKKLRLLENEKCRTAKSCFLKKVDLQKTIENLCTGCDIVLAPFEKTVSCFSSSCVRACCDGNLIIDAFLNLISNAARFSSSQRIDVTLKTQGDCFVLGVENDGEIDFSAVKENGGLAAARAVARLHDGRLLVCKKPGGVFCAVEIPSFGKTDAVFCAPDFSSLIRDEFSAVHVGLADVELY